MSEYVTCKTVGELIEHLKTFDPNLPILTETHHMEQGTSLNSPVVHKNQYIETQKNCVDAFDYGRYTVTLKRIKYGENQEGIDCVII